MGSQRAVGTGQVQEDSQVWLQDGAGRGKKEGLVARVMNLLSGPGETAAERRWHRTYDR